MFKEISLGRKNLNSFILFSMRSKLIPRQPFLKKYNCPEDFDFLNIDVENHEIEVIKGLDFKTYKPKIIAIEIHVKKTEEIFKSDIYKYLKKRNYELISQYYQTSFFKIKDFHSL